MRKGTSEAQLGFDLLLAETDRINERVVFEKKVAHLPATMAEAIPFMKKLIERHHERMLAGDAPGAMALRREAHDLALRLNNGEPGILASDKAPGCVLAKKTAAKPGSIPLWGQEGRFPLSVEDMQIDIEVEGVFGIGASSMYWLGLSAHALDQTQPFISETGYVSFLGLSAPLLPSLSVDAFAQEVIEAYIRRELKGRLVKIERTHRRRAR